MRYGRHLVIVVAAAVVLCSTRPFASSPTPPPYPTLQQFLSPASPQEIVTAKKADAVAWADYAEGKRNVYVARAPLYTPVPLTSYTKDDGVMISKVEISADGSTVTFMKGVDDVESREGWNADPSANPDGTDRSIWAARAATPGVAWKIASAQVRSYELAPDGTQVVWAKDGEIFHAKTSALRPASEIDRGEKPFIREHGTLSDPQFSPDSRKIAFVANRTDHSLIGIYDVLTRTVSYLSPSVDLDTNPVWSADGKHVTFFRRPGLPFGQQAQAGAGGIGGPGGPAAAAATGNGRGGGGRGGGRGAAAAAAPGGAAATAATGATGAAAAPAQQQAQAGAQAGRAGGGGGGGFGGGQGGNPNIPPAAQQVPGLTRATFKGGYAFAIWTADVATGAGHEVWHPSTTPQQGDPAANGLNQVRWAGDDTFIFAGRGGRGFGGGGGARGGGGRGQGGAGNGPAGVIPSGAENGATPHPAPVRHTPPDSGPAGSPTDQWDRYYSLTFTDPDAKPVLLTTTDGLIEDQTSIAVSADGKTFYYCTNANDIERRHIWAVPSKGGTPTQITTGEGIETMPQPLASGKGLATLSASWNMPQSLGIWTMSSSGPATQKIAFPTSRKGFPVDAHVKPEIVMTVANDGLEIHNQLFLPKNIKPGEKRPALVFVHGGPVRQMLPAYHYMQVYHWFYGVNEWLASQGYVVLSINYRSGIGYGSSFRSAPNTESRGNSEYQDVVAGAEYLRSRPDVDPSKVAIWGLSYGGLLTAQALARNSDLFVAGADFAGVHLYGNSLDPEALSYQSSAISQIDHWKSPVYLVQGDDDRNVAFQQMTGLVQLLRQRDVYFELTVLPDDVHESLIHARWLRTLNGMSDFFHKFLGDAPVVTQAKK